jgi:hypothetical protein
MQCIRCGRKMENTTGGNYHCPSCNTVVNDLVYRPSEWKPFPQDFGKQEGWICPVCGRGVAPWVGVCPCQSDWKITYGTATSINNDGNSQSTVTDMNSEWNQYSTYTEGEK